MHWQNGKNRRINDIINIDIKGGKFIVKKLEIIKSYYESNMGKGLPEYRVLGWESQEAQHLRFDILISSVNLEGKKLLDVGCGTGNLMEYILSKNINLHYTGVDILETMILQAKNKNLIADFYCMDIFEKCEFKNKEFDVVYSSGIFNLNMCNNKDFLNKAVKLLLNLAKETLVFNLLHIDSPNREDTYCYYHPDEVRQLLAIFSEQIKEVKIIESYLQNDFTVICQKA